MTHQPTPEPRKATGPTTQAGKNRSRLNALTHGLAGKTVVMPWEDREAYEGHCAEFLESLAPVGEIEIHLARGIADDLWRLSRARTVDTNMFALGQFDYAPTTGDDRMDAALNTARAFRDHSQAFSNFSLYEQRINRSLEKNFARLEALQQERRARERAAQPAVVVKPADTQTVATAESPSGEEFVYSSLHFALATTPPPVSKIARKAA